MPPRNRSARRTTPKPIESITHDDKRTNLPTADAQEFVTPDVQAARQAVIERDPTLDPQLVWRGKFVEDDPTNEDLVTDAPPIYIQEKIDPRVLIENLRRTAAQPEDEPELTLFDSFDGLDELDLVDFYEHQANWSNRMILGDSLQVMASLTEREELRGQVQMIYIDPPYGIKFGSNWQASARKRDVKDGKIEDTAREAEQIKAFRDTWAKGIHSYLSYLRDRLLVARELLTESGSCFVQIGDENVHLVRSLMDEVFGPENFVNQISFATTAGATSDFLANVSNYILWFAKDRSQARYRPAYVTKSGATGTGEYRQVLRPDGSVTTLAAHTPQPDDRLFRYDNLTSQSVGRAKGDGAASWFPVTMDGKEYRPSIQSRWKTNEEGMRRLLQARRVHGRSGSLAYIRYLDDFPAMSVTATWGDTAIAGRPGEKVYVVQTSPKVIERCMLMCTDPGDLVLDPTCGSGTTAYVAEQWGRRWITIDTSRVALALARQRLMGAKYPMYLLADSKAGRAKEGEVTGAQLPPAPMRNDIRHGFVYERIQHITLKSIANNPDIREGMTRHEIDTAIKRHADFELLYDKPYEDKHTVRVAGPFTVESLSPHRSIAFAGGLEGEHRESISEQLGAEQPDAPNFEQSILDNLAKAGIQNGRRGERLTFSSTESYPGTHIQALGVADDSEARVGIAIGPQYGTVNQRFVRDAVREAIQAHDIDTLCVLGFAFDAQAGNVTEPDGVTVDINKGEFAEVAGERKFGNITLLQVRMNVDLLMGEELKKTGAGNLFTVFGEPDIDVRKNKDGGVSVELHGVDVYDPTTGQVRSKDTGQIALWMIDTNYNGDSFFVRQCYFTGGGDPYKRLKNSLKAEIDADAWSTLYSTESAPFAIPETGRIAVKVINDYGDEVMKVYEVS
jgi:adenine-specific DNA-methyltransferase